MSTRFPLYLAVFTLAGLVLLAASLASRAAREPQAALAQPEAPPLLFMPDVQSRGQATATYTPSPTPTVTPTPTQTPIPTDGPSPTPMPTPGRPINDEGASRQGTRGADAAASAAGARRAAAAAPARAARALGIEGWGFSTIDLQNLSDTEASCRLDLRLRGRAGREIRADLVGLGARSVELETLQGMQEGFYHGLLETDLPAAAVVRTTWPLTATSAYQAFLPSEELLLPLLARDVDGHYGIYYLQNADEERELNEVTFQYFDGRTGGLEAEWVHLLETGDVIDVDALEFDSPLVGLPSNVGATGFLGALRIRAQGPVAMMAYGNEAFEGGVSAYRARGLDETSVRHVLPLLRNGADGRTVIALASAQDQATNVTLSYREHAEGGGARFEQQLQLAPRGSAFVGLGDATWSTVPAAPVPEGFVGSAFVSADLPITVMAMERGKVRGRSWANAAYNGFTPEDMGTAFAAPALRYEPGALKTYLYLTAGDAQAVQVDLTWIREDGAREEVSLQVPAGETRALAPAATGEEQVAALLRADGPLAALVYESPFFDGAGALAEHRDSAASWAPRLEAAPVDPVATATPGGPERTPTPTATATQPAPETETPRVPATGTPPTPVPTPEGTEQTPASVIHLPFASRGS